MTDVLTKLRNWRPTAHPETIGREMVEAVSLVAQAATELERFEDDAQGIRLSLMMQERDDCAALAETLGAKEIAKAIRARRD